MFPPFQQEIALHYLRKLQSAIACGDASIVQVAKESAERKNQGIMLGCLVCYDPASGLRKVLYASSGIAKKLIAPSSYSIVEPIVSAGKIEAALLENDEQIHKLTDIIKDCSDPTEKKLLSEKRRVLTDQSLCRVFDLYTFTRFDGKKITLNEIIKKHGNKLPPTGTGDCCAPKLLSAAFSQGLKPLSMAEIYYGESRGKKVNGQVYEPCDERCAYILPDILGIEILYRDKDIIVINKESGLLSVPGRGQDKEDCAEARVRKLFGPETGEAACELVQPAVHRLDMETSGILILAMNKKAHAELNRQFSEGLVQKKYTALLDGILHGKPDGHIELKFRLDTDNRPYQIYDEENGKLSITDWHKCGVEAYKNPLSGKEKKVTRIDFYPKTGRTHQLRLVSSDFHGLGIPILGDSLYGKKEEGERLMLHSCEIEFLHPRSQRKMKIICPPSF